MYAKSQEDINESVRIVYNCENKSRFPLWFRLQSPNYKSHLIFTRSKWLTSTQIIHKQYFGSTIGRDKEALRKSTLQQDETPFHASRKIQDCKCPRFWSKDMLPLTSPDLNPINFSVWSSCV